MKTLLLLFLLSLTPVASAQFAGHSCPDSGQVATNVATGQSSFCMQVQGSLELLQQPDSGERTTSPVAIPSPFILNADIQGCDPNPFVDIRCYGARAVSYLSIPSTTATISSGSSIAVLASAGGFQNGDGVTLYGAGTACSLNRPGVPTVTPSVASGPTGTGQVVNGTAGSSSYTYEIVARGPLGCHTAASASGSTNTGATTLGAQSVSLSTLSAINNLVTVTTSVAHTLPVGCSTCPVVDIVNTSDSPNFGGWYVISSVPDKTHFTYYRGNLDTRTGSTSSAMGGTAYYFNCNHLSWRGQMGAYVYDIYGRTGGDLIYIGTSKPNAIQTDYTFDDYGAMMTSTNLVRPAFVPNMPPPSATSNNLTTKIISGAGTNSLALANSASTSVTSNTVVFDDAPAISAAAAAILARGASGGTLYIPTSGDVFHAFIINSYLVLPSPLSVSQAGQLYMNDTIQTGTYLQWFGDLTPQSPTSSAFQIMMGAPIQVNAANPAFLSPNNLQTAFRGVQFNANANGKITLFVDQGQFLNLDNDAFYNGNGGNYDYMGMGVYIRFGQGFQPTFLNKVTFVGSTPQSQGITATPMIACNVCGSSNWTHVNLGTRGIAYAGGSLDLQWLYDQGGDMPALMLYGGGANSSAIRVSDVVLDTMTNPIISTFGPNYTNLTLDNIFVGPSADLGGVLPSITGLPAYGIKSQNGNAQINNAANSVAYVNGTIGDGIYSGSFATSQSESVQNQHFALGQNYSLFSLAPTPAAATCSVARTGPPYTTAGTWYYAYVAVYPNGGWGKISGPSGSCTTNGTSQRVTIHIPSAIPGAVGYFYFYNGTPITYTNAGAALNSSATTSLSYTWTGSAAGAGSPTYAGGGPAGIQNGLVWAARGLFGGVTVANLPSASSNPGALIYVTDSTAISLEGQTCTGGASNKALAFSNGILWKCF